MRTEAGLSQLVCAVAIVLAVNLQAQDLFQPNKPPVYFAASLGYAGFNFNNKTHSDYPPSWYYPVLSSPNKAFGKPGGITLGLAVGLKGGRRVFLEVETQGTYYRSSKRFDNYHTSLNFYTLQIGSRLGFMINPESRLRIATGPSVRFQRVLPVIFNLGGRNSLDYDSPAKGQMVLSGAGSDVGMFADLRYLISDRYDIGATVFSPAVSNLIIKSVSYKIRPSSGFRTFYWKLELRLKSSL